MKNQRSHVIDLVPEDTSDDQHGYELNKGIGQEVSGFFPETHTLAAFLYQHGINCREDRHVYDFL